MNGLEATRKIRQELPKEEQPPIIALTANAFKESKDQCMEAGMDDVLTKPIVLPTLESTLKNYITKGRK